MMMSSLRLRVLKILTELVSELVLANKIMQIDRVKREVKRKSGSELSTRWNLERWSENTESSLSSWKGVCPVHSPSHRCPPCPCCLSVAVETGPSVAGVTGDPHCSVAQYWTQPVPLPLQLKRERERESIIIKILACM